MSLLRAACAGDDLAAVCAHLVKKCAEKKGPHECPVCALTGVVAAALEGNVSIVQHLVKPWLGIRSTAAAVVSSMTAGGASAGASSVTGTAEGGGAAGAEREKLPHSTADGSTSHSITPGSIEWQGVSLAASTEQMSDIVCFRSEFYNEINLHYIHYGLRDLRDAGMPAVLKAAALGGSVPVLRVLLQAHPGLLQGRAPNQWVALSDSKPVAEHTLNNAAAHGRTAFLTAVLEGDVDLQVPASALRLALGGGHLAAGRCLLGYHGAPERRLQVKGGFSKQKPVLRDAINCGSFSMLGEMRGMTMAEDGFNGEAMWAGLFSTDDYDLRFTFWQYLTAAMERGTAADLSELLNHQMTHLALACVKTEYGDSREIVLGKKLTECAEHMMNSLQPNAAECAAKLSLLLAIQPPGGAEMNWNRAVERAAGRDWVEGLRVLLLEMPAHHTPVHADANNSRLFRYACCQNKAAAAEMLLSISGPHAVDPRARHQAAMRTACWRSMPCIVALLLRQTGERGVRMQPGKRSFFYGALRPKGVFEGKTMPDGSGDPIDPSDPRMDDRPGGYTCLKLLLGATGAAAVPPHMWAHGADGKCKRADLWGTAPRGPVERQYRDVGWGGGIQRMSRRDMVLKRAARC